jgi:arylsulfatase A-like enzyme
VQPFALRFIENARDKPILLMVNHSVPHSPYSVPHARDFDAQSGWDENQKRYAQMVANLDRSVGRIEGFLNTARVESPHWPVVSGR